MRKTIQMKIDCEKHSENVQVRVHCVSHFHLHVTCDMPYIKIIQFCFISETI